MMFRQRKMFFYVARFSDHPLVEYRQTCTTLYIEIGTILQTDNVQLNMKNILQQQKQPQQKHLLRKIMLNGKQIEMVEGLLFKKDSTLIRPLLG
jgi:hypothetical protein